MQCQACDLLPSSGEDTKATIHLGVGRDEYPVGACTFAAVPSLARGALGIIGRIRIRLQSISHLPRISHIFPTAGKVSHPSGKGQERRVPNRLILRISRILFDAAEAISYIPEAFLCVRIRASWPEQRAKRSLNPSFRKPDGTKNVRNLRRIHHVRHGLSPARFRTWNAHTPR